MLKLCMLIILIAVLVDGKKSSSSSNSKEDDKSSSSSSKSMHSSGSGSSGARCHGQTEAVSCLGQSIAYDLSSYYPVNQFRLSFKYKLQPNGISSFNAEFYLFFLDGVFPVFLVHENDTRVTFRTGQGVINSTSIDGCREWHELTMTGIVSTGKLFIDGESILEFSFPTSISRVFIATPSAPAVIMKLVISDLKLEINNEDISPNLRTIPDECKTSSKCKRKGKKGKGKNNKCKKRKGYGKPPKGHKDCLGNVIIYDVASYAVDTLNLNMEFKITLDDTVSPSLPRFLLQISTDAVNPFCAIFPNGNVLRFIPGSVISTVSPIDDWHSFNLTINDSKFTIILDGNQIGDNIDVPTGISKIVIGASESGALELRGLVRNLKLEINNEEITDRSFDVPEECR